MYVCIHVFIHVFMYLYIYTCIHVFHVYTNISCISIVLNLGLMYFRKRTGIRKFSKLINIIVACLLKESGTSIEYSS